MSEPVERAEMYPDDFSLASTKAGDAIIVTFKFRDPDSKVLREVQTWLSLEHAASLSGKLATLCKQFGVEPAAGRQTMQ